MTGSGKSTLARELLNVHNRAILILPAEDPVFQNYGAAAASLLNVARLTSWSRFRVRYICEHPLAFEFLCFLAWERGDCVVFVDELHEFCPKGHTAIPPWFRRLVLRGRHRNVSVIGVSQRPANVHNDFLSQAASQKMHVFRLVEPSDLERLSKIIPNVDQVKTFAVGEHLSWP